jgi:hypothetical protein
MNAFHPPILVACAEEIAHDFGDVGDRVGVVRRHYSLALMDRMQMLHTHAHHTQNLHLALVPVPTV